MDIQDEYLREMDHWGLIDDGTPKRVQIRPEIVGQKFDRLTIVSSIVFKKDIAKMGYKCLASCLCNNNVKSYQINSLRTGNTKSCGCFNLDPESKSSRTHELSSNSIYNTWKCMMNRCYDKNNKGYDNYGGRGIVICDEWHDIRKFSDWANENGYSKGLQIDRIDPDKNYSDQNCRFVTHHQNNMNRKGKRNSTSKYKGVHYNAKLKNRRWYARINPNRTLIELGRFETEKEAALAYNEAAKIHFGEHAYLNKIEDGE